MTMLVAGNEVKRAPSLVMFPPISLWRAGDLQPVPLRDEGSRAGCE
jgi:hypothetical protein